VSTWVGYIAAVLTTAAFFPQVVQTVRTGETKHISRWMYVLFCIGVTLWLFYGILIGAWPVIIANVVTLLLAGTILFMKLKNG
jgi:MtN3 and saliva related transmembrane protein